MRSHLMPTEWQPLFPFNEAARTYEFDKDDLETRDLPLTGRSGLQDVLDGLDLRDTTDPALIKRVFGLMDRSKADTPFRGNLVAFGLYPYKEAKSLRDSHGYCPDDELITLMNCMAAVGTPLVQTAAQLLDQHEDPMWYYCKPFAALQSLLGCVDPESSERVTSEFIASRESVEVNLSHILPSKLCRIAAAELGLTAEMETELSHDNPAVEDIVHEIVAESKFTPADHAISLAEIAGASADPYAYLGLFGTYNMYYSSTQEVLDHVRSLDLSDVNKSVHAARDLPLNVPEDLLAF